jgi:hypothetical protein
MPPWSGSYLALPIPALVLTIAVFFGQGILSAKLVAKIFLSKIDFNLGGDK